MPDLMPAPGCTATSAPSPIIFLTVSGVAATRGSDGSASAATAIFMMPPRPPAPERRRLQAPATGPNRSSQKIGHPGDDDDDDAHDPPHQRQEIQIGLLVG